MIAIVGNKCIDGEVNHWAVGRIRCFAIGHSRREGVAGQKGWRECSYRDLKAERARGKGSEATHDYGPRGNIWTTISVEALSIEPLTFSIFIPNGERPAVRRETTLNSLEL